MEATPQPQYIGQCRRTCPICDRPVLELGRHEGLESKGVQRLLTQGHAVNSSAFARIATLGGIFCAASFAGTRSLEWESVGPDGGRVDGLVQARTNPDRMYALLYAQGVHRSDDKGASWTRVDTGLPVDCIYVALASSSVNPDIVLVAPATGNAVLRSIDAGVTWTAHTVASGLGKLRDIEFDPFNASNLLLTVEGGTAPFIHRSTDGGLSWSPSVTGFTSSSPWQIEYHPSTPGTVLVAADGGVFRSTNGGVTWTASNMNGHGTMGAVSYCRNSPSTVWSADLTPNRLLRSTDGGLSFANTGSPPCFAGSCNITNVVADISNPATILGGFQPYDCGKACYSEAHVRRSTNNGADWGAPFIPNTWVHGTQALSSLFFDVVLSDLAFCSIGNAYGHVYSVGMARTTDSGQNWSPWMNGLHGLSILMVKADGAGGIYTIENHTNALRKSSNAGTSWESAAAVPINVLDFEANRGFPAILDAAGGQWDFDVFIPRFARSTNAGTSWTPSNLPNVGLFAIPECVTSDPASGQFIYMWCTFGTPGFLFRSTNGGQSFNVLEDVFSAQAAIVSSIDPMRVCAIRIESPSVVELSTDGGVTWTSWANGLPAGSIGFDLFGSPDGALVTVFRTAGAYRSTGFGANWTSIPLFGYQGQAIISSDYDGNADRLSLCTETGEVYVGGHGFVSEGLTGIPTSVAYDPESKSLFTGTDHASVFRLDLGGAVDAPWIGASNPPFCSIAASPNPSRGVAHFSMTLARDVARARIDILDVRGRRVAALFDGALPGGSHQFSWDGRNEGSKAASGIYFARLEADGHVTSSRVVLIND